jgi:Transposase, Mutator family
MSQNPSALLSQNSLAEPAGLSKRESQPCAVHPHWHPGISCPTCPRSVLDGADRALSADGERVGERAGGDVLHRCLDPQDQVTETRAGTAFSASSVSEMNRTLDTALTAFATWRLEEPILPNPVRVTSGRGWRIIASQAALKVVAVDSEGQRQVLGVDLAHRASASSWRTSCWGRNNMADVAYSL